MTMCPNSTYFSPNYLYGDCLDYFKANLYIHIIYIIYVFIYSFIIWVDGLFILNPQARIEPYRNPQRNPYRIPFLHEYMDAEGSRS